VVGSVAVGFILTGVATPAAAPAAEATVREQSARAAVPPVASLAERHIFNAAKPHAQVRRAPAARELGLRFSPTKTGQVRALRFYRTGADDAGHRARLWSSSGELLANVLLPATDQRGWQRKRLAEPVTIAAKKTYVVSYSVRKGGTYASRPGEFEDGSVVRGPLTAHTGVWQRAGVFPDLDGPRSNYFADIEFRSAGGSDTTHTGFPDASNTGVPDGTPLSPYSGPCTISSSVTLTAVDATSCGGLLIRAANVTISKSLLPRIDATSGSSASVTITDSTVRGGNWSDGAVWGSNFTLVRSEVTGGQHNVHCNDNCTVIDSWLHDQYNPDGQGYHNNAFITNGGSHMVLRHNTLHCTAILNSSDGGCTADVSLFGDFDPVSDVLVENNFLRANDSSISYCAYGGYQPSKPYPIATQVRYVNNVFERGTNNKCGVFGPVTSFQSGAAGNVWSGNVWDKGGTVNP
jgi:hypothetical protein